MGWFGCHGKGCKVEVPKCEEYMLRPSNFEMTKCHQGFVGTNDAVLECPRYFRNAETQRIFFQDQMLEGQRNLTNAETQRIFFQDELQPITAFANIL